MKKLLALALVAGIMTFSVGCGDTAAPKANTAKPGDTKAPDAKAPAPAPGGEKAPEKK